MTARLADAAFQNQGHIQLLADFDDVPVFVLEGKLSQETKDKALVAAASAKKFDTLKYKGKTYYFVEREDDEDHDIRIDGINNEVYFSFAIKNKSSRPKTAFNRPQPTRGANAYVASRASVRAASGLSNCAYTNGPQASSNADRKNFTPVPIM